MRRRNVVLDDDTLLRIIKTDVLFCEWSEQDVSPGEQAFLATINSSILFRRFVGGKAVSVFRHDVPYAGVVTGIALGVEDESIGK